MAKSVKINQCPKCRKSGYKFENTYKEYSTDGNKLVLVQKCSQCDTEFAQRFVMTSVQVID